jgi:type IV secretory pathway VirB2 component (pilin)
VQIKIKAALAMTSAIALLASPTSHAQKSGGGGGVERAGDNAADLISTLVGPLLIVLIGVVAIGAFIQRNVGLAVSATLVGLIAGLFIFDPNSAESAFKDVYEAIF